MLTIVRFWILLSTLLVSAGWILSVLHQLNRTGYGMVVLIAGIVFIFWRQKTKWHPQKNPSQLYHKFRRRFKRLAPVLFLVLALMCLAGGTLYDSMDGDSKAYRIPRVFHWLAHGQWHWISTFDSRMNIAATGFEWLSAPLLLFTRTNQFLFLINWASYLMLPGLIFSVFTRLQVRPRVAWWWMWLLASGWCYVLQASSDMNDSFAVIYALASVDFALRAREKNSITDLWFSVLAAGLLTGTKQTILPLVLLWLIAAWPGLRLLFLRPMASAAVVAAGLLVSILPVSIFNFQHFGNWCPPDAPGLAAISGKSFQLDSPFWGIVGNAFCIPVQNLLPPFFPWSESWNVMMDRFVQTPFGSHFSSFEHFGQLSLGSHGVTEDNAGIGLGICTVILISVLAARCFSKKSKTEIIAVNRTARLLRLAPWALLLLFMAKVGTYDNARQLAAYYPFFFPLFLNGSGQMQLTRQTWWQRFCLLVMAVTAAMLLVSRDRPLFPAQTVLGWLQSNYPHSKIVARAKLSFQSRVSLEEEKNYVKTILPPDEKTVGFVAAIGHNEVAMWLPFGRRKVECLLVEDPPEKFKALGIHYVVVEEPALARENETIEQWMKTHHGELAGSFSLNVYINEPPQGLYLVHLRND